MKDEIIAELWRIKDDLAREANYDVHLLCQQLRQWQDKSSEPVVDRSVGATQVANAELLCKPTAK